MVAAIDGVTIDERGCEVRKRPWYIVTPLQLFQAIVIIVGTVAVAVYLLEAG